MSLHNTQFICLDCEFTGLDLENDRLLELAAVRFTFSETLDEFDTLVNPECTISEDAFAIHHISAEMVHNKPRVAEQLPDFLNFIGKDLIVGHGVGMDLDMIEKAAQRAHIPFTLKSRPFIDTLRLARHYGDSPNNSLERLAAHFNVPNQGSHRALNDVKMNIEVFKHLTRRFKTLKQVFDILASPIKIKYMPLGKHKGRLFSEIPLQYLQWAAHLDFDQDLLYSIRLEIKKRKKGGGFKQVSNPFSNL
ncbi:MAG: 3'-5' exonuclease DinG [Chlamydiales bacterium]|nr:3'-5' exonuclease DinG [Chlamydiales bacterium]